MHEISFQTIKNVNKLVDGDFFKTAELLISSNLNLKLEKKYNINHIYNIKDKFFTNIFYLAQILLFLYKFFRKLISC